MKHACACAPRELGATASARTPRPASLRASRLLGTTLAVRNPRFNKQRPSCVTAAVRDVAASAAAAAAPPVSTSNGNGADSTAAAAASEQQHQQQQPAQQQAQPQNGNGSGKPRAFSVATAAVHGGETQRGVARQGVIDALTTPIVQTSTYTFKDTAELIAFQEGTHKSFEYGRYGNPTARAAEEKIMAMEGAEDCLLSASGMCSATTMLLSLVPAGGHIVTTTDCYRRTRQFIQTFLPKLRIGCTVIDPSDLATLERALEEHEVSLFFSESPTNPYLRCIDIPKVSELCHKAGAIVCVDSTFATPCNQQAIALGADLVIHSATKYLAGHNDVLAGSIAGRADLVETVRQAHNVLGGVIDPHAAYLLLRGMKTLDLRVERQNKSALELARRLEAHPKIARVHYPGLPSHPDHEIAVAQMSGFGGVVSFEVDGDLWRTAAFIDAVRLPRIAPSLGGVESLIEQPTIISYWDQGPEARAKIGIKDSLVRFSVGVEAFEDIWADVEQALDQI